MSVEQQRTKLVQKSLKQHIIASLTTAGWTSPGDFVDIGNILKEQEDVPIVGIPVPLVIGKKFEVGNSGRRHTYLVDIECKGQNGGQLTDLMDSIAVYMNSVSIIDFNVAETTDVGYDADAQKVATGLIEDDVRQSVVDETDFSGRVSFRLRESQSF